MKKLLYTFIALAGLTITSCEPMEDVQDEINHELNNSAAIADVEYTLTEDDYDDIGLSYPNFNSVDDARNLLPDFLLERFPYYGSKSAAKISFDIYQPLRTEDSLVVYTVTTEDYDMYEETEQYNNFDDEDQIYTFLNDKYSDAVNRMLVSLTYKYYDGTAQTLNNGFLYVNGEWNFIQGFTDAEYNLMGESYANFSSEEEAETKIPIYLEDKFKYETVEEGDIQPIMYKLYDGASRKTLSYVKYFIYTGEMWETYDNTIEETIQFGNVNGIWVPDNTIRYTLSGADYGTIATALADKYPNPADSADNYGNFDRRPTNANYWNDDMILEGMNILLDTIAPNAEEGQKYVITYEIYNGSNGTEEISLIKADGEWVINTEE